jgi:hypothetical protein
MPASFLDGRRYPETTLRTIPSVEARDEKHEPRLKRLPSAAESGAVRTLLVLALVVAALVYWEARRELGLDHRLSAIASEVAGRPVNVDCPGFFRGLVDISGNGGSVMFGPDGKPSNTTRLETSVCGDLAGYGKARKRSDFACVYGSVSCSARVERTIYAALILSHESQHLRGVRSEAVAECYAIQMLPLVAQRLGSPPEEAKAIATHFLTVDQPLVSGDYALPPGCVNGGSLDLDPSNQSFP